MSFKFLPHPRRERPPSSSPWEPQLKITHSIRFQSKPAKNACTASSYPLQEAKSVLGNCESRSCSRSPLIIMEHEGSPAVGLCPETDHSSPRLHILIYKFKYGRIIYPYVFQAVSLSSGLQLILCARFSTNLIFPANFFLPCVMSPSYLMRLQTV